MRLFDSTLQLLQNFRDSYDLYEFSCKSQNLPIVRFKLPVPHEAITFLLYNIRFVKSPKCTLEFLFLEFIRLGYNPFRPDSTYKERIMIKSVIEIIDKSNGFRHENTKKNK